MAYLYNRPKGANSNTIQHKANIPSSQDANRFKIILNELCAKSLLEKEPIETGNEKVIINYIITIRGKSMVEWLKTGPMEDLWGFSLGDLL